MKVKRDYELIINGKYNTRAIMQRAWAYVKAYKAIYNLASALKQAWNDAKVKMKDWNDDQKFSSSIENGTCFNGNLRVHDLYSDPAGSMAMGYVTK